jgi:septum formation protein
MILASNSPRRKDILTSLSIQFKVVPSHEEECSAVTCFPEHLPILNAVLKCQSVAYDFPDHLVLGADTVVELDGQIIEKPEDEEDALRMLMMLSGRRHQVVTGVCLIKQNENILTVFAEKSIVEFNMFDQKTAEDYMKKVYVLDKAGSYAVQEHGEIIIKDIIGSESNVIGLPVEKLLECPLLKQYGII